MGLQPFNPEHWGPGRNIVEHDGTDECPGCAEISKAIGVVLSEHLRYPFNWRAFRMVTPQENVVMAIAINAVIESLRVGRYEMIDVNLFLRVTEWDQTGVYNGDYR